MPSNSNGALGASPGARRWSCPLEETFQRVKIERERVAGITEKFLEESFSSLLAEADRQILEAEDDVVRGISGSQGRLRQAELAKEAHRQRRDERVEIARRSGLVSRGQISLLGSVVVLPAVVEEHEEPYDADPSGLSKAEIEAIAIGEATRYEEARGATWESTEKDGCGFDLRSVSASDRRCIEVKGRAQGRPGRADLARVPEGTRAEG